MPRSPKQRQASARGHAEFGAYVVDPASTNIAWASRDVASSRADRLATAIGADIEKGLPITLGIMMPTWIPMNRRAASVYGSRNLESAALLDLFWLLSRLKALAPELRAFVRWKPFVEATGPKLFVWEAYRGGGESNDLAKVLTTFVEATTARRHDAVVATEDVLSIVGAALVRLGMTDDIEIVRTPLILVGRPAPVVDDSSEDDQRERDKVFIEFLVKSALKAWFTQHDMPFHAKMVEAQMLRDLNTPQPTANAKKARRRPRA